MTGMLCHAAMIFWHCGQADLGVSKLYFVILAGWSVPLSDAHCSRQFLSIMMGSLCITTFKKLPTTRPNRLAIIMKMVEFCWISAINSVMSLFFG